MKLPKLTNKTLLWGGLGVLGGLVAYNMFLRSAGDKAKVGDEVLVPPSAVPGAPDITRSVEFIIVKVTAATGTDLTGQVIGASGIPNLPFGPSVTFPKKAVIRTIRAGQVV